MNESTPYEKKTRMNFSVIYFSKITSNVSKDLNVRTTSVKCRTAPAWVNIYTATLSESY